MLSDDPNRERHTRILRLLVRPTLYAQLEEVAASRGISIAELVRRGLALAIKKYTKVQK